MVSLLKSSSEQGTFKQALEAPVSGWHIVTGHPKPHEKRVRRQVSNLFPTPVLTGASPTPTTTKPPPSSIAPSSTVMRPTTTTIHNTGPVILRTIGQMNLFNGKALRYQIPAYMFYDREDGDARNLRLQMRNGSLGQLPSWIMFDSLNQVIYGLPLGSSSTGLYEFVLSATDKGGETVSERFKVQVSDSPTYIPHMFTICLNYDYEKFKNVGIRVQLMRKITFYYGLDLSKLHLAYVTYKHGAIFFAFTFESSDQNCNSKTLQNLIDGFGTNNRELNPNFQPYLLPEFDVLYGFHEGIELCTPPDVEISVPEVNRKIDQLSVSLGQGMDFVIPWNTFYDRQDFYTRNLKLEIRTRNGEALSATSWIGFDSSEQTIYAQPNASNLVGHHKFRIVAIDSGGLETFTNVKVLVVDDTSRYNHEFSILLESYSYEDLAENTKNRMSLLEAIAKYYQLNLTSVRIAKYLEGVSFHFRFDSIPYEECDNPLLKRIINGFWNADTNEVNKSFVTAMKKDNKVLTGFYYFGIGPCEGITPKPISNLYSEDQAIEVFHGQAIRFHIPYNTFYDDLDFYAPNLRLSIKTTENKELPPSFWIFFNSIQQDIYGLPLDISTVGQNNFHLVARNRRGKEGFSTLSVNVLEENVNYINMFTIHIENYNAIKRDVYQRVKLIDKIASYYDLDYNNVRVFSQNTDTFTFGFDTVPAGPCDDRNLLEVKNGFWSDGNVNPKFVEALSPDFNVISGYYQLCGETNTPPRTIKPTKRQTVFEGQAMKYPIPTDTFYDKEDGYTHQLKLVMTTMKGKNLLQTSWILLFDSPQQEIISLPIGNSKLGVHRF